MEEKKIPYVQEQYDVVVVGAGHAGCEAALACARLGLETIIFTVSVDSIAMMPCNPNIGGSSKGHLVREIDALGGEMGKNIDKTFIQSKMLNKSKGPAVHSLRAQADKMNYSMEMRKTLQNTDHLTIRQAEVSEIITELNRLGGKHGIGIVDIVENRVVGMKSRGVYETPGGTILMEAHDQLEELVLDRATYEVKKDLGNKFAQIVYEGKWYTPLREAIQAFVDVTQQYVTGEVKFRLYKGNIIRAGETSPYSLYSESLASFTTGDLYDHHDADGFINLFGLPLKVRAMKMQEVESQKK